MSPECGIDRMFMTCQLKKVMSLVGITNTDGRILAGQSRVLLLYTPSRRLALEPSNGWIFLGSYSGRDGIAWGFFAQ